MSLPVQTQCSRGHAREDGARWCLACCREGQKIAASKRGTPVARFWAKVEMEPNSGCWIWCGCRTTAGYGHFTNDPAHPTQKVYSHRFAYELLRGPIPRGLQIDHRCRLRACVNPDHMDVVSQRENILRGTSPSAQHAQQTHCKWGHSLADAYHKPSKPPHWRDCRVCALERARRHSQERRENKKR